MEVWLDWLSELSGIPKLLPTTLFTSLLPVARLVLVPNGSLESAPFLVWQAKMTRLLFQEQASGTDKIRHRATSYPRPTVKNSLVSAARALNCSQSLKKTLRS